MLKPFSTHRLFNNRQLIFITLLYLFSGVEGQTAWRLLMLEEELAEVLVKYFDKILVWTALTHVC